MGVGRPLLFALAAALVVVALGTLDRPAHDLLSVHMAQHLLLGDLAPVLALVALRGPLFHELVPRRLAPLFRIGPLPSLAVWAAALLLWHVPAAYGAAAGDARVHVLQHLSFALGGVLVWNQLVDPAGRRRLGLWPSLGFALSVLAVSQLLAMWLVLGSTPVYAAYAHADGPLTPLRDQQLAALVMMLGQWATLGTFAFLRLRTWARAPLAVEPSRHPLAL